MQLNVFIDGYIKNPTYNDIATSAEYRKGRKNQSTNTQN